MSGGFFPGVPLAGVAMTCVDFDGVNFDGVDFDGVSMSCNLFAGVTGVHISLSTRESSFLFLDFADVKSISLMGEYLTCLTPVGSFQ